MPETIFITGASGQLGRLVIDKLLARGASRSRIIAGSRSPEKLDDVAARGVEVRKADFEDGPGLSEALRGVDTVLLISTELLDAGGHRVWQHRNAIAAATKAGVKRIAYTSVPNPETSLLHFAPDHVDTEAAVRDTGLPFLIFRNGWYQENLLLGLPTALQSGRWHTSSSGGRTTYIAREDIADAIAAAIVNPPAESKIYTLTGPDSLSMEEVASLAADATGKPLTVMNVTDDQFEQGLKAAGVPEVFATVMVSSEKAAREGGLAVATNDAVQLTGHPQKSLADFLKDHCAALVG